jgi:hypothetical protein
MYAFLSPFLVTGRLPLILLDLITLQIFVEELNLENIRNSISGV